MQQDIEFKYFYQRPAKSTYRVNITALHLYGLYRNSIHDSYSEKPDLAEDIKRATLHDYSISVSLSAMKEWQESAGKMKCFMAIYNNATVRSKIGFVHFTEKTMNGKNVVYIAQAGVQHRGQGIGRQLMEHVLTHYPAGTEFYILTRVFNSDAINLYEKRLKFTPIAIDEIKQLGYDERYCGFKHTTTEQEILDIKQTPKLAETGQKHSNNK